MKAKGYKTAIASMLIAVVAATSQKVTAASNISDNGDAKPFTFWYWMYGAVSKAGIHADLKGMKDVGLGGCYLMPIRGVDDRPEYGGKAQQQTPEFWEMVDYAFKQADSLGLDMGIHICDGFALAGHPTITPEESMQKIVWTDTIIGGGKQIGMQLKKPEGYQGYYKDLAVYAIRFKERPQIWKPAKTVLSDNISTKKGYMLASTPATITYSFDEEITVRSIMIRPNGNNFQSQRLVVEVSDDGTSFRKVKQLVPPRQGWQNTGAGYTFSVPATKGRVFRFVWNPAGTEKGAEDFDAAKWKPLLKLEDIKLSNMPRLNQWEGKTAAVWRIDRDDEAACEATAMEDVIPLTMASDGTVDINLPEGNWMILRMGHTSTGQMNATAGGGKGLEVDKMNRDAVNKLINNWFLKFMERPHSTVVKYLHVDSWECATQNWGRNFAEEFKMRRGYDIMPYMPLFAGIALESEEKSEQVLRDVRLTISEITNDVFYGTILERAHIYRCRVSHESIAPTYVADGLEHYKYSDIPMGEYWLNSPTHDKPNDMLDAISGAHIYGKRIVQAEGFTEVRGVWNETPAMIKPLLDRNFALGMNRLFFHVDAHNPWIDRKPGMTLDGIGLFFQRDNTWYRESSGMVDYITDCQKELQKGQPIVDVAVFTGEDIPSRALTPDKVKEMLPEMMTTTAEVTDEMKLEESPVGVVHAAGILDLKDWTNCLRGYKYDSMNRNALLSESRGENGRLKLSGGMEYRILVVPQENLSEEVKNKIEELRKAGVVIVDEPYRGKDFIKYGVVPDAVLPDSMDYAHRRTKDEDIYFVTNQAGRERHEDIVLRDGGKVEVYLPAYGSAIIRNGKVESVNGSTTNFKMLAEKASDEKCCTDLKKNLWQVFFEENGEEIHNVRLPFDWSKTEKDRTRYFSGHASMETMFKWNGKGENTVIRLDGVADMARVIVNGVDCGVAWTAPYAVDITKAVKKGKNTLKVVVVNTWHNALQGMDEGKAPYEGIWTNAKYRTKDKSLLKAGLDGAVIISY